MPPDPINWISQDSSSHGLHCLLRVLYHAEGCASTAGHWWLRSRGWGRYSPFFRKRLSTPPHEDLRHERSLTMFAVFPGLWTAKGRCRTRGSGWGRARSTLNPLTGYFPGQALGRFSGDGSGQTCVILSGIMNMCSILSSHRMAELSKALW